MGLQTWTPSKPPLSSMACLDVETPSICRVLQLCLQQRRTREQLVEQGIMPPLKAPATFHQQIRSLERAKTGNLLKHKLGGRPERSELIRMHILEETQAEASLQATQMKLKRARLADDLNRKIAKRPGPVELVEKNILPVDSRVKEVNIGDEMKHPKIPDVYSFDEDSGDSLCPDQLGTHQEAPGSTSASPRASGRPETASPSSHLNACMQATSDTVNLVPANEQHSNRPVAAAVTTVTPGPHLLKQSQVKSPSDKSRSKKNRETKPRVKKLKYHQYIPPDQKQELSGAPMDSAYARLLQQQQQFLQLQILNQQQQYVLSTSMKSTSEGQTRSSGVSLSGNGVSTPVQLRTTPANSKPDHLPANLEEMKVAELKMELKLRSLPVSGTKTDLIERLRFYQENSNIRTAPKTTVTMGTSQWDNIKLTPPVSPVASKVSSLGTEDSSVVESPKELPENPSKSPILSSSGEGRLTETSSEKDQRLHEKELQIEALKRKLEQEQRLVEELKMQLEVEKRVQQGGSSPQLSPPAVIQVKEESKTPKESCCSGGQPEAVKQEEKHHFIVCHQTLKQREALQTGAQIAPPGVTIQLPSDGIKLHPAVSGVAPSAILKVQGSTPAQQQCTTQLKCTTKPEYPNHVSKCKDPPCYEDAVKQTRSMLTAVQGPAAVSQHMDDLFDVLIKSGEISPFIKEHPGQDKPTPVTASVTTLPVNTVLSRPPPLIQLAQVPTAPLNLSNSLMALESDTQLETLLDGSLGADTEPRTLKLMEELHSPLNLDSGNVDNMDWLDLTMSGTTEGLVSLDITSPVAVFSSNFLDSHELHLNWE
ncbi:myocardin-related transcription factor B isoform X2 [Thalassophryne amazonica]|uniref:myocardin-related transcription factor B isoform X2 n=1 Tax=Thalassophryne amazonica TaxID=390379 RepID=UPI001471E8CA|nr:myocardin-related transcription factor B isoform X2 [Thalassophryne amazonica]